MENELKINLNNQEKDLLLKDLCSRLPYGVICDDGYGNVLELNSIDKPNTVTFKCSDNTLCTADLDKCKPYLFPMSSMTEEQEIEYGSLLESDINGICYDTVESIDWLNKNNFDYRELIPMGLAKDATGLNIYINYANNSI